jgi:hypothetical protein
MHDIVCALPFCTARPDSVEHRIQQEYGGGGVHGHCECGCVFCPCSLACSLVVFFFVCESADEKAPPLSSGPYVDSAVFDRLPAEAQPLFRHWLAREWVMTAEDAARAINVAAPQPRL